MGKVLEVLTDFCKKYIDKHGKKDDPVVTAFEHAYIRKGKEHADDHLFVCLVSGEMMACKTGWIMNLRFENGYIEACNIHEPEVPVAECVYNCIKAYLENERVPDRVIRGIAYHIRYMHDCPKMSSVEDVHALINSEKASSVIKQLELVIDHSAFCAEEKDDSFLYNSELAEEAAETIPSVCIDYALSDAVKDATGMWIFGCEVNPESALIRAILNMLHRTVGDSLDVPSVLGYVVDHWKKSQYSDEVKWIWALVAGVRLRDLPKWAFNEKLTIKVLETERRGMLQIVAYNNGKSISKPGMHTCFYDVIVGSDIDQYGGRLGCYGKQFIASVIDKHMTQLEYGVSTDDCLDELSDTLCDLPDDDFLKQMVCPNVTGGVLTPTFVDGFWVFCPNLDNALNEYTLVKHSRKIQGIDAELIYKEAANHHNGTIFDLISLLEGVDKECKGRLYYSDLHRMPAGYDDVINATRVANQLLSPDWEIDEYTTLFDKLALAVYVIE